MLVNRFSTWVVVLIVAAIALGTLLTVNAYLEKRRSEGSAIHTDTYYPLPPGKQTALINAAIEGCLDRVYDAQAPGHAINPDTYYPLPPGKLAILVTAARQACIDEQLSEWAGK